VADFEIKAHDRLPALRVQLQNESDESPVDLTNATSAEFIMSTAAGQVPKINAVTVMEDPRTQGIVRYDWAAVDTATPGSFIGEIEVTWTGGKKQTFPTSSYFTIAINADLDAA
jgi:hypothetical protein